MKQVVSLVLKLLLVIVFSFTVGAATATAKDLMPIYELSQKAPIEITVASSQNAARGSRLSNWELEFNIKNISGKPIKALDIQCFQKNDFDTIVSHAFETTISFDNNLKPDESVAKSYRSNLGDMSATKILLKVRSVLFTDDTKWPSQEVISSSSANDTEYQFMAFSKMSNYLISKDLIGTKIKTKALFVGIENMAHVYTMNIQQNKNYPNNLIYIKLAPSTIKSDMSFAFALNNFAISKEIADAVFALNNFDNVDVYGEYKEFEVNYMLKNIVFVVHKIQPVIK